MAKQKYRHTVKYTCTCFQRQPFRYNTILIFISLKMASQSRDYKALKDHMSKQNQNEMALKCVCMCIVLYIILSVILQADFEAMAVHASKVV